MINFVFWVEVDLASYDFGLIFVVWSPVLNLAISMGSRIAPLIGSTNSIEIQTLT